MIVLVESLMLLFICFTVCIADVVRVNFLTRYVANASETNLLFPDEELM